MPLDLLVLKKDLMLQYLLKFTIRGLGRNRTFTAINIVGLTLGMSAFMLINAYTSYEKSYEQHIPDRNLIYRVTRLYDSDQPAHYANNFAALGPYAQRELPEVMTHGRLILTDKIYSNFSLSHFRENQSTITFNYDKAFFADQGIVDLFLHDWVAGDRHKALDEPDQVILSATEAAKYFGQNNPIGQQLKLNSKVFRSKQSYWPATQAQWRQKSSCQWYISGPTCQQPPVLHANATRKLEP